MKRTGRRRPLTRTCVGSKKIQPLAFRPVDSDNADGEGGPPADGSSGKTVESSIAGTGGKNNHRIDKRKLGNNGTATEDASESPSDTKDHVESSQTVHAGTKRKRDNDDPILAMKETTGDLRLRAPKHPCIRMADAAIQTGSYGLELMSGTRGARTSCFSASVKDDRIWFWHYNPTGVLYTNTSISIIDDFEYFSAIIIAFASCSAEQFGALPLRVIPSPDGGPTVLLMEDLCGHKLTLSHPATKEPIVFTFTKHIFTQYGLTGRRTFIYEAEVIIKCSYQSSGRRPEHELIDHARKHEVSHLPNVHIWGDVWILQDLAQENYQLAKKRLLQDGKDCKSLVEPQCEDRVFRVIVYSRYYSLWMLLSKHIELLPTVVNQVLDCLHDLRHKANMLHRDISVNNIMWEICDNSLTVRVIDFNIAKVDDKRRDCTPSSKHRSGTLPFMAPELLCDAFRSLFEVKLDEQLPPVKHLLRHDILSLFFVSIWCVEILLAEELPPDKQQHIRARAKMLKSGGLEAIAAFKQTLLTTQFAEWCLTMSDSSKCLRAWLKRWGEILKSAYWDIARYKDSQNKTDRHPDDKDDDFDHTGVPFDFETASGRLTRDYLKQKLSFYMPPQTCTAADIGRECIPQEEHLVGPSIPFELRKPVKDGRAGRKKGILESDAIAVEDRRNRLQPRKNGKAVTAKVA